MNKTKNRRRNIFANKMHKAIFLIVFLASMLPSIIVTILLYYLIFGITAEQFAIPEAIAYNIIPAARKVTTILLIVAPICILAILIIAYNIAHKMIGPFDRILRELDERIEGKTKERITLRADDKFWPLVNRINKLLDKIKDETADNT